MMFGEMVRFSSLYITYKWRVLSISYAQGVDDDCNLSVEAFAQLGIIEVKIQAGKFRKAWPQPRRDTQQRLRETDYEGPEGLPPQAVKEEWSKSVTFSAPQESDPPSYS